jgi:hypothetical protein
MLTFETERLLLTSSNPCMAEEVLNFYKNNKEDFEATEPIDKNNFYTIEVQKRNLSMEERAFSEKFFVRFWIFLKENPKKIIGTFSFSKIKMGYFCSASLGYKIDKEFRHKGYCTEAIRFGLYYAKNNLNLHRIFSTVNLDNKNSISLLLKLGFDREGLLKDYVFLNGKWTNQYLYAKIL